MEKQQTIKWKKKNKNQSGKARPFGQLCWNLLIIIYTTYWARWAIDIGFQFPFPFYVTEKAYVPQTSQRSSSLFRYSTHIHTWITRYKPKGDDRSFHINEIEMHDDDKLYPLHKHKNDGRSRVIIIICRRKGSQVFFSRIFLDSSARASMCVLAIDEPHGWYAESALMWIHAHVNSVNMVI